MLVNDERRCDLCQREIAKGERYAIKRLDGSEIPEGFTARTFIDTGQIVFNICQDCQSRMGLSGEAAVD